MSGNSEVVMDVIIPNQLEVSVNLEAIEPKDYFTVVKSKIGNVDKESLQNQLSTIAEQILEAKKIGQKKYLEQLVFAYTCIIKEQALAAAGYTKYVYKDDVKLFIDKITPANSVKIIELDRYPRAIPLTVMQELSKVQAMNIFDDYCVVFTDFTDADYKSSEEMKTVERNRDPIVFGYFKHKDTGLKHDRFYYVADWEDEYCELTFTKMIEKMTNTMGMVDPEKEIKQDPEYLQEIINSTLEGMVRKNSSWNTSDYIEQVGKDFVTKLEKPESWFARVFPKRKSK